MADSTMIADEQIATDRAARNDGDTAADEQLIDDELLVEEISIDGMCGVY